MKPPLPIFDSLEYIDKVDLSSSLPDNANVNDCQKALEFLNCYKGSQGTFNAYRREIERLLHWCTLIAKKPLIELKRHDIEEFIHFCQKPPKSWIGINKVTRFIAKEGKRISNPEWRPFVVTVSKAAYQKGERPNPKNFEISFRLSVEYSHLEHTQGRLVIRVTWRNEPRIDIVILLTD